MSPAKFDRLDLKFAKENGARTRGQANSRFSDNRVAVLVKLDGLAISPEMQETCRKTNAMHLRDLVEL